MDVDVQAVQLWTFLSPKSKRDAAVVAGNG